MVRWLYNTGTERMMAPDALTLMGITNEGRDIPVKLLGEDGSDGRYVIALVSIRKVYEFVLHRFQNEVFVFHNCDRNFNAADLGPLCPQRQADRHHRYGVRRGRLPAAARLLGRAHAGALTPRRAALPSSMSQSTKPFSGAVLSASNGTSAT